MTQLLPDPPLSMLPYLPENMRWLIDRPATKGSTFVRVHLQVLASRHNLFGVEKMEWQDIVDYSIWDRNKGYGDFRCANTQNWWRTDGLASVCGHLLHKVAKGPLPTYSDVYGASRL